MPDGERVYSITSVTEALIGNMSAVGDSQRDREVLSNLEEVNVLLIDLVKTLGINVNRGEHSYEGSVQAVGVKSRSILDELRCCLYS